MHRQDPSLVGRSPVSMSCRMARTHRTTQVIRVKAFQRIGLQTLSQEARIAEADDYGDGEDAVLECGDVWSVRSHQVRAGHKGAENDVWHTEESEGPRGGR